MNMENKDKIIQGLKNTVKEQQCKIERYEKVLKSLQYGDEITYKIISTALQE